MNLDASQNILQKSLRAARGGPFLGMCMIYEWTNQDREKYWTLSGFHRGLGGENLHGKASRVGII